MLLQHIACIPCILGILKHSEQSIMKQKSASIAVCCVSIEHLAALQGAQYDDDEGYEDTLDDGGDEGPTY